jgi:hypothetical protein
MSNIIRGTGDQVVDGDDPKTFSDEAIGQMGSKKSRSASHDRYLLGRSSFKHG